MRVRQRTARALLVGAAMFTAIGLTLGGCSAPTTLPDPPPPSATVAPLPTDAFADAVELIVERLDTARQVAASKWFSKQPVADAAREQAVLDAATAYADQVGADRQYVTDVFTAQIAASKLVQQSLLDAWVAGSEPPPAAAPDLTTQVRPLLDRITGELVSALHVAEPLSSDPRCVDAVAAAVAATSRPITPAGQDALATAVASLCD